MTTLKNIWRLLFFIPILLHELTHYVVGKQVIKRARTPKDYRKDAYVEFKIPIAFATMWYKLSQDKMWTPDPDEISNQFGVEYVFPRTADPRLVFLFGLAPTLVFSTASLAILYVLGLTPLGVLGAVYIGYAALPSTEDLHVAQQGWNATVNHYSTVVKQALF